MDQDKKFITHIDSSLSDTWTDQSEVAKAVLDHVLYEDNPEVAEVLENQVAVEEEKRAPSILAFDSGRTKSRVLFVTTDAAILEKGSAAEKKYLHISEWFDELHIMVLLPGRSLNEVTERISTNVWVYVVQAKDYTVSAQAALHRLEEDLLFNDSLRPDIVVATDPLTSGVAAKAIGERFGRVWQVQIKTHFFGTELQPRQISFWETRVAKKVLRTTPSVRFGSAEIAVGIKKIVVPKTDDQKILPQYYNFDALKNSTPVFDLKERYPEYKLIIVTFGLLTADSNLHDVFVALRNVLHKNRIGLIIIGDGPAKKLFVEKAQLLDIEKNVVFVSESADLIPYYKTADVLIETGLTSVADETVLRAIAAGLPTIAYETELRSDLLKDGRSALLCPADDPHCLSQNMGKFLNNQGLRTQFRRRLNMIADSRLHEDKRSYFEALRDSVEIALVPTEEANSLAVLKEPQEQPEVVSKQ